ncbi:MAG: hypothetical protein PHG35_05470 [Dehalococcoidales bacterium]|nr:hypothetical protein [Dehalococcoidales bacterium]
MRYLMVVIALLVLALSFLVGGCNSTTNNGQTTTETDPVSVVSVKAVEPANPGGPTIEVTLKNTGTEPVVSLKAGLYLEGTEKHIYDFPTISSTTPLQPDEAVSQTRTLIGPEGYSDEEWYSLTIDIIFQNGTTLSYLKLVQIE